MEGAGICTHSESPPWKLTLWPYFFYSAIRTRVIPVEFSE